MSHQPIDWVDDAWEARHEDAERDAELAHQQLVDLCQRYDWDYPDWDKLSFGARGQLELVLTRLEEPVECGFATSSADGSRAVVSAWYSGAGGPYGRWLERWGVFNSRRP